jgi:hypothetical protein
MFQNGKIQEIIGTFEQRMRSLQAARDDVKARADALKTDYEVSRFMHVLTSFSCI